MRTQHRVSEIERQKRNETIEKTKKKNSQNKTPIRLQKRGDITNNESHEQFFCETFFLHADNKKRITDIDTTIIRTIIILPNTPIQHPCHYPLQSHGVQAQFMTQKSTLTPQHAPNRLITHIIYAVFFQSIWCFCILSSKQ